MLLKQQINQTNQVETEDNTEPIRATVAENIPFEVVRENLGSLPCLPV